MDNSTRQFANNDNPRQKTRLLIRPSVGGGGWIAEIRVSVATVRRLRTQIRTMRELPLYDLAPDIYEKACEAMVAAAAPDLVAALHAIQNMGAELPALIIIRGLQVDDTPVITPIDGVFSQSAAAVEAAILIGVMRHYGLSGVAFDQENDGKLFRAVCPVERFSDDASSQGAKADLLWHSDNGHFAIGHSNDPHPYRFPLANPFQWFATIRPRMATPMRVKLNADVMKRLDPRGGDPRALPQFTDLQRPEFRYGSPPSHGTVHKIEPLAAVVTLDDTRLGHAMRFHAGTTEGTTPRAKVALELLKHAWQRTPEEVIFTRRGDIIGYDNRRVTHRRESYRARFDGKDRFYVRVYGQPIADVARWIALLGDNGRIM